ncbi:hypothetical protein [Streptomyces sp. 020-2-3H-GM]
MKEIPSPPKPTNDLTEAEAFGPIGYIARSLAHLRDGRPTR